jgi:TIR domain
MMNMSAFGKDHPAGAMDNTVFFLFVSHVREDRVAELEIVIELERRVVRCWVSLRDVRLRQPFDDEITDAIYACQAMLLIFRSLYKSREQSVSLNGI